MATTHSTLEAAIGLARDRRKQDLDDLIEELSIPSISTLPERREDCLRAARWLRDRFTKMGMQSHIVGKHTQRGTYGTEDWLRMYAAHAIDHADQIRRARGKG